VQIVLTRYIATGMMLIIKASRGSMRSLRNQDTHAVCRVEWTRTSSKCAERSLIDEMMGIVDAKMERRTVSAWTVSA
jgi:hypothetical protein